MKKPDFTTTKYCDFKGCIVKIQEPRSMCFQHTEDAQVKEIERLEARVRGLLEANTELNAELCKEALRSDESEAAVKELEGVVEDLGKKAHNVYQYSASSMVRKHTWEIKTLAEQTLANEEKTEETNQR